MTDPQTYPRNVDRTFRLVCINFAMLLILFLGIGFLLWQSSRLVRTLQADLARAEQGIAQLRERVQGIGAEAIGEQLVELLGREIREALPAAVKGSALGESVTQMAGTVEATAERVGEASESIVEISHRLQGMDADAIAQQVSYHLLKGLGEGFTGAAESRRPAGAE